MSSIIGQFFESIINSIVDILMSVYQLIYTSQSTFEITEKVLLDILTKAQINNFNHQISGLLILFNSNYIQLIEGNKKDVTDLFNRIKNDSRHKNIRVLIETDSLDRDLPTWFMGVCVIGENYLTEITDKSYYIPLENVRKICDLMSSNLRNNFITFLNSD
jgi:hypothetical protein